MNPSAIIGSGIAAILLVVGAYFYGDHIGYQRCENAHMIQAEKDRLARDKQIAAAQAQDAAAAEADVQRETVIREITREVPKIIDRPVYRDHPCLDADGLQLLDRAVAAANGRGAPGGGPDGDAGRVRIPSD